MDDKQQNALDNLRSGNHKLSSIARDAIYNAVVKASQFINDAEDSNDLLTNIKVLETATKMVGLTPKESNTHIQINAINGFEFIQINEADILQISSSEEYEEAEYEDEYYEG